MVGNSTATATQLMTVDVSDIGFRGKMEKKKRGSGFCAFETKKKGPKGKNGARKQLKSADESAGTTGSTTKANREEKDCKRQNHGQGRACTARRRQGWRTKGAEMEHNMNAT
jgi:hypothetical protein